jgi:hypothetical protein
MRLTSALCLSALAFALCGGIANTGLAGDTGISGAGQQKTAPDAGAPSGELQNRLPGTGRPSGAIQDPAPDAGTTGQAACIDETGDYETHGTMVTFVIGLANKCDKRLKCAIFANVTGAKGSSMGHTTIILGAKSSGAAAKKSYAMKVKAAGGTAQVSRDCRVF